MPKRIILNKCKCNLVDQKLKILNNDIETEFCENCFEIISYRVNPKIKKKKSIKKKLIKKIHNQNIVTIDNGGKYPQILMEIKTTNNE